MKILFICPYYNNSHFLNIQINSFKKYLKNCEWKILVIDDSNINTINVYNGLKENVLKECEKYKQYVDYIKYPYTHTTNNAFHKHQEILNYMIKELTLKYREYYDYIGSFDADMCLIKDFDAKKELDNYDIIGPKRIQSLGNYQLSPEFPLFTYFFVHCCFFNIKNMTNIHTMSLDNIEDTTTDTGAKMIQFMFNNPQYKYKFLEFSSGHEKITALNSFEFFYNNTFIHFLSGSLWNNEKNSNYIEDINKFKYLIANGLTKDEEELIDHERSERYRVNYHRFFSQREVNINDLKKYNLI